MSAAPQSNSDEWQMRVPPGTLVLEPVQFAALVEMAQLGLRLANKLGTRRYRDLVAMFRASLLGDVAMMIPDAALAAPDIERRRRAAVLSDLLMEFDRGHEAVKLQLRAEQLGATPEQHRRTAGNPIARLFEAEKITPNQMRAATEIRECAENLVAGACLATSRYAERIDQSRPASYLPPGAIHGMEVRFRHYGIWCRKAARLGWPLKAMLEVIVLGHSFREVERTWRVRTGSLPDQVDTALSRYVRIAGWRDE